MRGIWGGVAHINQPTGAYSAVADLPNRVTVARSQLYLQND